MIYVIYSLSNPITNEVFYIGKTKADLLSRVKGHIREIYDNSVSPKRNIISSILKSGFTPIIEEVDYIECPSLLDECHATKIEEYWIGQFKQWGFELSNSQGVRTKFFNKAAAKLRNNDRHKKNNELQKQLK